jgi:spore maturation protein CgeB
MNIVILGLSITSAWGNGHATTYRALARALSARGHELLFLERASEWWAGDRDLPEPVFCRVRLYASLNELQDKHGGDIEEADLIILGSYVPEGVAIADLVLRTARGCTAFYDIDTPLTLAKLQGGGADYIERRQISGFDLYLSFTGGPTLDRLERKFRAQRARPLYCSVDEDLYFQDALATCEYDLGYLGKYRTDRQPTVQELLFEPARAWPAGRFVIVGAQYPRSLVMPSNVRRIVHLSPADHRGFYNGARFMLNVTRREMIEWCPRPTVADRARLRYDKRSSRAADSRARQVVPQPQARRGADGAESCPWRLPVGEVARVRPRDSRRSDRVDCPRHRVQRRLLQPGNETARRRPGAGNRS